MSAFTDFLLAKMQEYEAGVGKRITLDEFALYIGVSRPVLSYWLNGKTKPSLEKARLLAKKFGSEVYKTLDLPVSDPVFFYISNAWEALTPEQQKNIKEKISNYLIENEKEKNAYNDIPA